MKLSVVGLGKLGACSAACFASKGFEVIGVDINKDFVGAVNNGKAPVYEPGLQELIDSSKDRLKATQDYEEAIKESDITFLIVPTPSGQDGHFSDRYLLDVLKHLSIALKKTNKEYHLFVITSTVSPGTTEES
jgi:UDPglucose 6-dehydrogenase